MSTMVFPLEPPSSNSFWKINQEVSLVHTEAAQEVVYIPPYLFRYKTNGWGKVSDFVHRCSAGAHVHTPV